MGNEVLFVDYNGHLCKNYAVCKNYSYILMYEGPKEMVLDSKTPEIWTFGDAKGLKCMKTKEL